MVGTIVAAGDEAPGWYVGTAICGLVSLTTGMGFGFGLAMPDGEPLDHELTESEARRATARYNQRVLERFVEEQRGEPTSAAPSAPPPAPTLQLRIGTGIGVDGRF